MCTNSLLLEVLCVFYGDTVVSPWDLLSRYMAQEEKRDLNLTKLWEHQFEESAMALCKMLLKLIH